MVRLRSLAIAIGFVAAGIFLPQPFVSFAFLAAFVFAVDLFCDLSTTH